MPNCEDNQNCLDKSPPTEDQKLIYKVFEEACSKPAPWAGACKEATKGVAEKGTSDQKTDALNKVCNLPVFWIGACEEAIKGMRKK